jgi:hypothetical protein
LLLLLLLQEILQQSIDIQKSSYLLNIDTLVLNVPTKVVGINTMVDYS